MQISKLLALYKEGPERCGFIIDGEIIEVSNVSPEPNDGFVISVEDVLLYSDLAEATWHTHPGEGCNLSGEDYSMFSMWTNMNHIIIGNDGLKIYRYNPDKKAVMVIDEQKN